MKQGIAGYDLTAWSEAQERARTYLRALDGEFGPDQDELLVRAIKTARERNDATMHPVTLVMHALFALLQGQATIAMMPPLQRISMLPEKIEFPFHEGLRRLFGTRLLPFAGTN